MSETQAVYAVTTQGHAEKDLRCAQCGQYLGFCAIGPTGTPYMMIGAVEIVGHAVLRCPICYSVNDFHSQGDETT